MKNYRLTIRKSAGSANVQDSWVNTYEFEAGDTIQDPTIDAFVDRTVQLEKSFHLADVYFIEALVSQVRAPNLPADPNNFKTFAVGGTGTTSLAEGGDDNLPLNNVMVVQRQAAYGRKGELRYRRALSGFGWNDQAGKAVMNPVAIASLQALFDDYITDIAATQMLMLPEDADENTIGRPVSALKILGIRGRQVRNNARPKIPTTAGGVLERMKEAVEVVGQILAGIAIVEAGGAVLAAPELLAAATSLGTLTGRAIAALPPAP